MNPFARPTDAAGMPIALGVNIDHVATVRNARGTRYPDPVEAALLAEESGADSITLHPREDRRHIRPDDVRRLRPLLRTKMNLECAVTAEMIALALEVRPQDVCLVPEKREEVTTEGGLDVAGQLAAISTAVTTLKTAGIRVSLFIDADPVQIAAAAVAGAPVIEIHTGRYADAGDEQERSAELARIRTATAQAVALGLVVNAGHGLTVENVAPIAAIESIAELNIGHSLIARSIFVGLPAALAEMRRAMAEARHAAVRPGKGSAR